MRRESEWTKPHQWCADPDRWTAPDPHSTECEVTELVAAFVRALQPDYVIETGTCWGQTAEAIGQALAANGRGVLHTLEVDPAKVVASRERCAGLPVEVIECPSLEHTPVGDIGFAWFDSLIPLRIPEFHRFLPWLRTGAIVGFHDTSPNMGTLAAEVASLPVRSITLPTPRGVTFAEVVR